MSGPDFIFPTEQLTAWEAHSVTKIRISNDKAIDIPPKSIVTAVAETCVEAGPYLTAFRQKKGGKWRSWSFHDYYRDIKCVARAFVKLGLQERHSVCISGFNSPEWFLSAMGCIFAGGMTVGLYPTNSAETNKFILEDCKANLLVVEDRKTLNELQPYRSQLPDLKKIIVWDDDVPGDSDDVLSWEDVIKLGMEDTNDASILERQRNMAINQCCVLVYTSGTTGIPKGVMLSHDNIYWSAMTLIKAGKLRPKVEVGISYLPLSHIAGLLCDMFMGIFSMATVVFADKMALKGTLVETLKEARPTAFFGVPRVWEKIMEGMQDKGRAANGLKKRVAIACKNAGMKYHLQNRKTLMYAVGKKAIYGKVREALGLDRCRLFCSSAAPVGHETLKFFLGFDIVIREGYGMSETAGAHCVMVCDKPKLGCVGQTYAGAETKLTNQAVDGNGEICMRGRNLMMGYLNREDKTTEAIDNDGWLHSGDIGSMDPEGYVYITGRIKELLITAGGENIAPIPIENTIKEMLPCLSNVILIGDKKKYLSCFLTFKNNDTPIEIPTDTLSPGAISWCTSVGSSATKVGDILSGPDVNVMNAIQDGIDRANKRAVSRAGCVQKWKILPLDLSIPTGELGPTLKLKRSAFCQKYSDEIETLYC